MSLAAPVEWEGGASRLAELAGITPHEMTEAEKLQEEWEHEKPLSMKEERILRDLGKIGPEETTQRPVTPAQAKTFIDRYLPEWKMVLAQSGGQKPKKFAQRIVVKVVPATFNPSALGDMDYMYSFDWDGSTLSTGPSYSIESIMNIVGSPYERPVNVPSGHRVWITVYSGQWGGYWHTVDVYVNPSDPAAQFTKRALGQGGQ